MEDEREKDGVVYDIYARNIECRDDRVCETLTTAEAVEWMLDREMRARYAYGSTGEFLLRSDGPSKEAFMRAVGEILCVTKSTKCADVYRAYQRITPENKRLLARAYDEHLGARRWLDEMAHWCSKNKCNRDLCGNESLVGRVEKRPRSASLSFPAPV